MKREKLWASRSRVRLGLWLVVGLACLLRAGGSEAVTLSYVDTSSLPAAGGNAITYSLDFDLKSGSTSMYSARLSVQNSSSGSTASPWFAGWFLFKFDGSASTVGNLVAPTGTGPWSIVNGGDATNILRGGGTYGPLQHDGFTGFYVTSLALGNTPDITQGALLTGSPGTSVFTFDFTPPDPAHVNLSSMPFQVGFYDGLTGSGNPQYGQLSATLSPEAPTVTPEPTSMLLLGSGLAAFGGTAWRQRRRRRPLS